MRQSSRVVLVGLFGLLGACKGAGDQVAQPDSGTVLNVVAHDISPPLRDMAKLAKPRVRDLDDIEAEPVRSIPHPSWKFATTNDRVTQRVPAPAQIAATTANFEGMGAGMPGFQPGGIPPDTDGDIGPNDYVQVVNISLAVFSRAGQVKMGPVDTGTIWTGFAGECAQTNDGDGTVRYDHIADRWVIAQFSLGSKFFQCVAVSTTPDPTGPYARYQFNLEALNDYPKMGLWPDAYYFTFNMFGNQFLGGKVCAMDRVKMLAGDASATMQCFDAGQNFGGLLAADLDGKTLPPAGAPNPIVALDSETQLAFWNLKVDFATPANSKFTGPSAIPIETFAALCNGGDCVKQPGVTQVLSSLGDRAMNRFVYRRFPDHESLLMSHSVTAGTGGGVRFYELRNPTTPTVFQQGTFAPNGAFRWIPSIAMDASGDIALMYTVSSTTVSPSIRYTARVPSDPPGTMGQGEGTIVAGTNAQPGINRWGDYSALNIDPVDDCTFWATNEYKKESGNGNWHTRIASFTLPQCSAFAITKPDAETVKQSSTAMYTLNTTTTAGAPQMLQLTTSGLPTGVTATLNPTSVMSGQPTTVTLTADGTATVGMTHYTLSATGTASSAMIDIALTVEAAPTTPDAGNGGDDDGGGGKGGGCCESSRGGSPIAPMLLGLGVLVAMIRRRRR